MAKISDLPDELLVKILSFLPTKVAVSTSILSKQWEFLWMWLPNLEFDFTSSSSVRDFVNKNLPLHKSPIVRMRLIVREAEFVIAVSGGLREFICISKSYTECILPSDLYTCNLLATLKLDGQMIFVDVPQTVCLPSLKTLHLSCVKYSNEDSLPLLLSSCPVLEDLIIERERYDNVGVLVIRIPSLLRLSIVDDTCSSVGFVIATPSLKYLQVEDCLSYKPYLIEHMPELEEADINVVVIEDKGIEKLFKSITTVKRLSFHITFNSGNESVYRNSIVFSRLENLKIYIYCQSWSNILFRLLKASPNLQILDIEMDEEFECFGEYNPMNWSINESSVPQCLLKSLKTFKFKGYAEEVEEERNFISFISKHACCLESASVLS